MLTNRPLIATARVAVFGALLLWPAASLHARSLADELHRFIDRNAFPARGEFVDLVTPIVKRLVPRGIDFPVTATSPGFSYRFNFELGVPERSSQSLGPVFVERTDTVGRRRLDLGVSYLYADLTDFDGEDFAEQIVTGGEIVDPDSGDLIATAFAATHFSLVSHIVSFSATYGITDAWDVNLLVPLVWNSLDLEGNAATAIEEPDGTLRAGVDAIGLEDDAFGFGDTLLRTKYRISDGGPVSVALSLALRLPSGDDEDFRGIGDTTVTPGLILSRTFGMQDVHGSLGVECNADDVERSRARYAIGVALQPTERLAFLVDLFGSSSFTDDDFDIAVPRGKLFPESDLLAGKGGVPKRELFPEEFVQSTRPTKVEAFVPRSDVVDLAIGLKFNPWRTAVGFVSVILPVTDDGLRADVIPAAGIEVSF
jgi:hypothetical protein